MSESSTIFILQAAAAGDPDARERFATRFRSVFAACLGSRWRDTPFLDAVDDAVQETMLECFREAGALERVAELPAGDARAFLFGVVRNVARRYEARRALEDVDAPLSDQRIEAEDTRLSVVFDRAFARGIVREAAALQRERAHSAGDAAKRRFELLELRFYHGLPIREIAVRWGEDPKRVHRQYEKAREDFRSALRAVIGHHFPATGERLDEECERLIDLFRS